MKTWKCIVTVLAVAVLAGLVGCEPSENIEKAAPKKATAKSQPNSLTDAEKKAGWKLLFDGKTTNNFKSKSGEPKWRIADGVMTVCPAGKRTGEIYFADTYSNFDLKLDFMITEGANSGIKYLVGENGAFEYQILDDERHADAKKGIDGNRTVASLYDMMPAQNKTVNPPGQWNHARIVVNGKHIEHWLNGIKVLEFERGSERFKKHLALSKFKNIKGYGQSAEGGIFLQDHKDEVSFRNIKIKEFK